MSNVKHTPTPWRQGTVDAKYIFGKYGELVAEVYIDADAEHVVKCVNSHDALVSALNNVIGDMELLLRDERCDHETGICWCGHRTHIKLAYEALKAANIKKDGDE